MSDKLKSCPKCGGRLALYTSDMGALILCRGCNADWQYDNVIDAVADNLLRPAEDALRAENVVLKAKWQGVPWATLRCAAESAHDEAVQMWRALNAPDRPPSSEMVLADAKLQLDKCTQALDWIDAFEEALQP
jgi:hypothetical protein